MLRVHGIQLASYEMYPRCTFRSTMLQSAMTLINVGELTAKPLP